MADEYKNIGLTDNLQSVDSVLNREQGTSDYSFTATSGAIPNKALQSVNWGKITAGTAVIGGYNDQSGLIQVLGTDGSVKVQIDSNGLTVYGGSITVYNGTNSLMIDSSGILSNTNFGLYDTAQDGINQVISGTGAVLTGATVSVVIPRTTMVNVAYLVNWYYTEPTGGDVMNTPFIKLERYLNGTAIGELQRTIIGGGDSSLIYWGSSGNWIGENAAGTNTYTLTAVNSIFSGTPFSTIYSYYLYFMSHGT